MCYGGIYYDNRCYYALSDITIARFSGDYPATRKVRGFGNVKPATPEERLASMRRQLANRKPVHRPNRWLTVRHRALMAFEDEN
jgi:hypothetical protein